jgi:hypothetical protein
MHSKRDNTVSFDTSDTHSLMWPKHFAAICISNSDVVHWPGVAVVHLGDLMLAQCCWNVRWMINVFMFVHNRLRTAVGLPCASVCSRSVTAGGALSNCQSDNIVGEELLHDRKLVRLSLSVKWLKDATFVCLFVWRFVTPLFTASTTECLTLKLSMWNKIVKVLNRKV